MPFDAHCFPHPFMPWRACLARRPALFERVIRDRVPLNPRAESQPLKSAPPPILVQNPKLGRPDGASRRPSAAQLEHYAFVTTAVNT
jgi:hypothetical protein